MFVSLEPAKTGRDSLGLMALMVPVEAGVTALGMGYSLGAWHQEGQPSRCVGAGNCGLANDRGNTGGCGVAGICGGVDDCGGADGHSRTGGRSLATNRAKPVGAPVSALVLLSRHKWLASAQGCL